MGRGQHRLQPGEAGPWAAPRGPAVHVLPAVGHARADYAGVPGGRPADRPTGVRGLQRLHHGVRADQQREDAHHQRHRELRRPHRARRQRLLRPHPRNPRPRVAAAGVVPGGVQRAAQGPAGGRAAHPHHHGRQRGPREGRQRDGDRRRVPGRRQAAGGEGRGAAHVRAQQRARARVAVAHDLPVDLREPARGRGHGAGVHPQRGGPCRIRAHVPPHGLLPDERQEEGPGAAGPPGDPRAGGQQHPQEPVSPWEGGERPRHGTEGAHPVPGLQADPHPPTGARRELVDRDHRHHQPVDVGHGRQGDQRHPAVRLHRAADQQHPVPGRPVEGRRAAGLLSERAAGAADADAAGEHREAGGLPREQEARVGG
mmetsp:Transcript_58776/g.96532  ORF Transcript_58776/g.96532 Transcript_58776/m.96532 type:complete len:370 (+) Transcript_58776:520-1629(+)